MTWYDTLTAIRQVLLYVMWAQEPDTVASNWLVKAGF
jgi:hypothetical protein